MEQIVQLKQCVHMSGQDCEVTDAVVLARVETVCKYKNTTGEVLLARLTTVAQCDSLARVMQNPEGLKREEGKGWNRFRLFMYTQPTLVYVGGLDCYSLRRLSPVNGCRQQALPAVMSR